jgi:Kef-type K+ transport system membrane component KefB
MTVTDNTANNSSNRMSTRGRPVIVGTTVVAALAVWALLSHVAGLDLEAEQGGPTMHIGGVSVFVASAVVSLNGWGLLALLERRTANARKIWTIVAVIGCALSLGSPLISGVGAGAKFGLASLHLVVGAFLIPGLRRTASQFPVRRPEFER